LPVPRRGSREKIMSEPSAPDDLVGVFERGFAATSGFAPGKPLVSFRDLQFAGAL